ncbi:SulP family inorganic anion transporter [[Limnothrix rosea] IAM M-220]|uniref:SulP family inorganic anion transporter n=1 Tax=[Limnothrix rosea] IAM M-220 TaxID=454133 RepID=UPI00096342A0|nr:SulP family inorganic anion transporter [[Limnothrix rosea] IAM M-220]OKH16911.1 sodium-independent anion transporter [[Limnothrix rosea] IAM M-220]
MFTQLKVQLPRSFTLRHWRGDLFGGLTAAIVALPLALAFGVSSGAGAIAGLYGAVCTGFFAALFGGTPPQISGPTGPMTVVIATIFAAVASSGDPQAGVAIAFTVIMLGGLFQIVLGALRLGKYITLIPYTVISGFMSGIGIIIILIQVAPLLGFPSDASIIHSAQMIPYEVTHPKLFPTSLGILTLIILFTSPAQVNRVVPSPLLALVICTLISTQFPPDSLARIGEIPRGLPEFHLPVLAFSQLKNMLGYGVILGTLGAIDSLLTSLVADNITHTQHDSDQELIGQGIGNIVSGLCGGLPGAGATMRTVINVRSGGVTSLSGMIHAVVLLIVIFWAAPLTSPIPHAVLAGILIKVGIDIIDWSFLKRAHRISLKAAALMYCVMGLTVFVDLITAVAVGVFIANLLTVKSLTDLQIERLEAITSADNATQLNPREKELLRRSEGRIFLFHLSGPMSFGAAKGIAQRMGIIEKYDVLILDLLEVPLMGVTASLALETMIREAHAKGREIFLVGASGKVKNRLQRLEVLKFLPPRNRVTNRLDALEQAIAFIENHQTTQPKPQSAHK